MTFGRYRRPWSWGRLWITKYRARRLLYVQLWLGHHAYFVGFEYPGGPPE